VGEERGQPAKVLTRRPIHHTSPAISRWPGAWLFEENNMATIIIKDLTENVDLDRKAMQAIAGGSRLRSQLHSRIPAAGAVPASSPRIVDFRTGAVPRKASGKQTG
jgi:hypothetical protein